MDKRRSPVAFVRRSPSRHGVKNRVIEYDLRFLMADNNTRAIVLPIPPHREENPGDTSFGPLQQRIGSCIRLLRYGVSHDH